jgi:hypothetical protein
MAESHRVEVVEKNFAPGLTKDRARQLLLLLFRPLAGEREDGGRDEPQVEPTEGEAA